MTEKTLVFTRDRHEARRWAEKTGTPDSDYIYVESIRDIRGRLTTHMPRVFSPGFHDKPGADELVDYLAIIDLAQRF